jgi:hypothetical protein
VIMATDGHVDTQRKRQKEWKYRYVNLQYQVKFCDSNTGPGSILLASQKATMTLISHLYLKLSDT